MLKKVTFISNFEVVLVDVGMDTATVPFSFNSYLKYSSVIFASGPEPAEGVLIKIISLVFSLTGTRVSSWYLMTS